MLNTKPPPPLAVEFPSLIAEKPNTSLEAMGFFMSLSYTSVLLNAFMMLRRVNRFPFWLCYISFFSSDIILFLFLVASQAKSSCKGLPDKLVAMLTNQWGMSFRIGFARVAFQQAGNNNKKIINSSNNDAHRLFLKTY